MTDIMELFKTFNVNIGRLILLRAKELRYIDRARAKLLLKRARKLWLSPLWRAVKRREIRRDATISGRQGAGMRHNQCEASRLSKAEKERRIRLYRKYYSVLPESVLNGPAENFPSPFDNLS